MSTPKKLERLGTKIPPGIFRGTNFMTSDVISYFRIQPYAGRTAYVELSEGMNVLLNGSIYGVTARQADGSKFDPDPSKCFHDKQKAIDYIYNGLKEEE